MNVKDLEKLFEEETLVKTSGAMGTGTTMPIYVGIGSLIDDYIDLKLKDNKTNTEEEKMVEIKEILNYGLSIRV